MENLEKQTEFLSAEQLDIRMQLSENSAKGLREAADITKKQGNIYNLPERIYLAHIAGLLSLAEDCETDFKAYETALEADYEDYFPSK
jgi:hypothetical protein